MYKIIFNLICHENFEFLLFQIKNIFKFNKNCSIIIHLSKLFNITSYQIEILKKIDHVFINQYRLMTFYCKALTPIILNIIESKNIDYEYMCLIQSNCLFFKSESYEYLKNYDCGFYSCFRIKENYGKWLDCRKFKIYLDGIDENHYSGPSEGVFLKKEMTNLLIDKILGFVNYNLSNLNYLNDTTEESFLPTAMNILFKNYKIGLPLCFHGYRVENFPQNDYNYIKNFIEELRNNQLQYKIKHIDGLEENHFYFYKRVNRNLSDDLAQYFNSLT
jgi:hypothetical protein